jgi:hypothetical protein
VRWIPGTPSPDLPLTHAIADNMGVVQPWNTYCKCRRTSRAPLTSISCLKADSVKSLYAVPGPVRPARPERWLAAACDMYVPSDLALAKTVPCGSYLALCSSPLFRCLRPMFHISCFTPGTYRLPVPLTSISCLKADSVKSLYAVPGPVRPARPERWLAAAWLSGNTCITVGTHAQHMSSSRLA